MPPVDLIPMSRTQGRPEAVNSRRLRISTISWPATPIFLLNGRREPATVPAAQAPPHLLRGRAPPDEQRYRLGQRQTLRLGPQDVRDRIGPERQDLLALENHICPVCGIVLYPIPRGRIATPAVHGLRKVVAELPRRRAPIELEVDHWSRGDLLAIASTIPPSRRAKTTPAQRIEQLLLRILKRTTCSKTRALAPADAAARHQHILD
jgi:hypothetical protein